MFCSRYLLVSLFCVAPVLHSAAPAQGTKGDDSAAKAVTIKGQITNADGFDSVRTASHQKSHFWEMVPGYTYVMNMSAQFATYLRLEDSKGREMAINDDFGRQNTRIVFSPKKAGTYRIIATTLGAGATGFYTLSIRRVKGVVANQIVLNLKGKLTKEDPIDTVRRNCHFRVHTLKMKAGETYVLFSATQTHDGYLRLETANKVRLMENDDYRDTRHSRMVFTPKQTATYRIVVTTFSAGATGTYTLAVTRQSIQFKKLTAGG